MPAPPPPLHLHPQFGPYAATEILADAYVPPFEPGDRVGGPPPRKRRRARRAMLLVAVIGLAAWSAHIRTDEVTALVSQATAILDGLKAERRIGRAPIEDASRTVDPLPLPERDAASLPPLRHAQADDRSDAAPPAPVASVVASATPPDSGGVSTADTPTAVERLPDVVANPADPLQQKALAAGLHPELSRALLEQLTPEDFHNAAYAVAALLKGAKADSPLVWPKRQAPHQARFKIRLVEGAPPECRRYVVQVAKNGWETTARPMERCVAAQAFKPS